MMNPKAEFSCEITHHEFDRAQLDMRNDTHADDTKVRIEVFDMADKPDTKNSKVTLTLSELREIVEIADRFAKGSAIIERRDA